MTIEERINEIKKHANYMKKAMHDFIPVHMLGAGGREQYSIYDPIVTRMRNASNREELQKAYGDYITLAMHTCGFDDNYIIAGIMANESQNKKFNVNIDSIIRSYLTKFKNADLVDVETATKTPDLKVVNKQENVKPEQPKKEEPKKNEPKKTETVDSNNESNTENNVKADSIEVKQVAPAHSETGFNINNFIKHDQPTIQMPIMNPANANIHPISNNQAVPNEAAIAEEKKKADMLLPHQTCKLSDEEIIAYNDKHYKNLVGGVSAYALYDLLKSDLLTKKMKELNAKDRPNNPQLKQVPITECTDEPNLIERYPLAFTMQCNDKGQVIVVLFNPNVELDSNGKPAYPLYVCKGKLIKPDGEKK